MVLFQVKTENRKFLKCINSHNSKFLKNIKVSSLLSHKMSLALIILEISSFLTVVVKFVFTLCKQIAMGEVLLSKIRKLLNELCKI